MKIKILRDIPGYKAGEIITEGGIQPRLVKTKYSFSEIIEDGFAEEIKDDIDIEAIREMHDEDKVKIQDMAYLHIFSNELEFFTAYRTVKTVIDQLNGDWKPDFDSEDFNKKGFGEIWYNKDGNNFGMTRNIKRSWTSILPPINFDAENALEIILKCEPELKVLFNIN